MNESNSIKAIGKTNLSEQTKSWVSEIIRIENFYQEINQSKLCSKKLSKYVTAFDYIDKILIVLNATSSGVSIISFTSIIGAPVGIASASLTLFFYLTTRTVKKLLNITRNKKKKHDKILVSAKKQFNTIENLIFQARIDMDINHKEFVTILKEKDKFEKMKDILRIENEEYKIMRLNSVKSKI